MQPRAETLKRIRNLDQVSVLIIGAGVNGIGTFRDLALQGVDVLMVDRADYCSGASMASSHMLHGGIRYLENGEFRLVREALRKRCLFCRQQVSEFAASPQPFVFYLAEGTFLAAEYLFPERTIPQRGPTPYLHGELYSGTPYFI